MSCRRVIVASGMLLFLASCSSGAGSDSTQQPTPPLPVQSVVQQAYVKASNTSASSSFGGAVALDANTMVVGAQSEGTGAVRSGAAYVFTRNGSLWTEQDLLKSPQITADERFGRSVAVSGNTLVVGAPAPPNVAGRPVGPGSAYVFTRNNGGTWILQTQIQASNAEISDAFGSSVALDGDTLVVGASGEDSTVQGVIAGSPDEVATRNGAQDSGAAYVFTRVNGIWTQQAYIKGSSSRSGDGFGSSVALVGNTLVVGAPSDDDGGVDSGAVYVFTLGSAGWVEEDYVKASNLGGGDSFGRAVALGNNILAVGAPSEDSSATGVNSQVNDNGTPGSGAVYLFARQAGGWQQEAYVKTLNSESGDNFGSSLGLVDGTLVVGAPGTDSRKGMVYVFQKSNNAWAQRTSGSASNGDNNDNHGGSIALSGNTIAVGAIGESSKAQGVNGDGADNSESASGAAYVYVMQ